MAPTLERPFSTYPIEMPQRGEPRKKLAVPSIGSTDQKASPVAPPISSPITASSGSSAARCSRMSTSRWRSASVTNSLAPFSSSANWARRLNRSSPAGAAIAMTALAASRRVCSVVMRPAPFERPGGRECRLRYFVLPRLAAAPRRIGN